MSTLDEIDLPTHQDGLTSAPSGGESSSKASNNADFRGLDEEDADAGEDDDDDAELEAMKARVAEMEAEAAKLREMQAEAGDTSMSGVTGPSEEEKEEVDSRSIYVGNVSVCGRECEERMCGE